MGRRTREGEQPARLGGRATAQPARRQPIPPGFLLPASPPSSCHTSDEGDLPCSPSPSCTLFDSAPPSSSSEPSSPPFPFGSVSSLAAGRGASLSRAGSGRERVSRPAARTYTHDEQYEGHGWAQAQVGRPSISTEVARRPALLGDVQISLGRFIPHRRPILLSADCLRTTWICVGR